MTTRFRRLFLAMVALAAVAGPALTTPASACPHHEKYDGA